MAQIAIGRLQRVVHRAATKREQSGVLITAIISWLIETTPRDNASGKADLSPSIYQPQSLFTRYLLRKTGGVFPPERKRYVATKRVIFPSLRREHGQSKGGNRYFPIRDPPGDCILRHPLPPDFFCNGKSRIKTRAELEEIGKVSRGFSTVLRLRIHLYEMFCPKYRINGGLFLRSIIFTSARKLRLFASKRRTRKTKVLFTMIWNVLILVHVYFSIIMKYIP